MVAQIDSSSLPEPEAAVGIITCAQPEESILLIKRNENELDPWSGHYAFPGGRRENGDEAIYQTCVREVHEETGIILDPQTLQQTCKPAPAGRNVKVPILVQPYVFRLDERPIVTIEEREIARHVWISVESFKDIENHQIVEIRPDMIKPVYPINDYYVWGFTYGLLCRLLGVDYTLIADKKI